MVEEIKQSGIKAKAIENAYAEIVALSNVF